MNDKPAIGVICGFAWPLMTWAGIEGTFRTVGTIAGSLISILVLTGILVHWWKTGKWPTDRSDLE